MAIQNVVSATLAPDTKAEILQGISDIRDKIGFLLTLRGSESKGLFKVGNGYALFMDQCYHVSRAHPEILPGVFDKVEFQKDYVLSKDLTVIASQIRQLMDAIQNTQTAVSSDVLTGSLEVYAAVKQHRDKVPGLNIVADNLGEFFKKAQE